MIMGLPLRIIKTNDGLSYTNLETVFAISLRRKSFLSKYIEAIPYSAPSGIMEIARNYQFAAF